MTHLLLISGSELQHKLCRWGEQEQHPWPEMEWLYWGQFCGVKGECLNTLDFSTAVAPGNAS
jgi:hypothetical protein